MLDDLLAGDVADAARYTGWLEQQIAARVQSVAGVLRFAPAPRPWQRERITPAAQ